MIRRLAYGLGAGERGVGVDQVGRRVDDAAVLAGIRVLILRVAVRTFALDVAIGQEHALHRIEELLHRLHIDEIRFPQSAIDLLRQLGVLRRMRRVPVVE